MLLVTDRSSVSFPFHVAFHTAMKFASLSLSWTHWALLPPVEVCAVSNICMQLFCRPLLPRPAIARPCREGRVAVVVYSGGDVDRGASGHLKFFVMSLIQGSPNEIWVLGFARLYHAAFSVSS
jgi:hypothetical protein